LIADAAVTELAPNHVSAEHGSPIRVH